MEDLKKNQKIIFLVLGIIAFVLVAFCPAVDLMGKGSVNGFKFVFQADGLGFSRILMFFFLLLPLLGGIYAYITPEEKWGKNVLYLFCAAAVLGLITLIALPTGCSFAFSSWLGLILCVVAVALTYVFSKPAK